MKKIILMTLLGVFFLSGCQAASGQDTQTETVLQENQEMIYGQIETIVGNDITLALAEAKEVEAGSMKGQRQKGSSPGEKENETASAAPMTTTSASSQSGSGRGASAQNAEGEMPSGFPEEMEEGQMPQAPDGGGGEMPSQQNQEKSRESSGDSSDQSESQQTQTRMTYTLTGDKKQMRIPVGTTVTTSLGTETTFSRLAAGDMLKIILEKTEDGSEAIAGIWIVG